MKEERDPRTHAIIGAAMEVHTRLRCGFLEAVYQEALAIEFEMRDIPFRREHHLPIEYRDRKLATHYQADFVCFDSVIVEIKALSRTGPVEESQVINYLKSSGLSVGLLLNFGTTPLEFKRMALTQKKSASSAQSADLS